MSQEPAPMPGKPGRSWRAAPAVGVVALVAALAGGAVAAIVTVSLDRGSRGSETVTVHEVTTTAQNVVATTVGDAPATTAATSAQLTLEQIYRADARGVVSVITTTSDGVAQGSGFVLDTSGYILTNQHVVEDQRGVRVSFSNRDNVK